MGSERVYGDASRWDATIAHIDMDAFFVGVELLHRPELRGKPVIVGPGSDPTARGVVTAASYEARKFGVHSALPLVVAKRRCPQAIMVPVNRGRYVEASKKVMAVLGAFSDVVEVLGIDEAYVDLSHSPTPKARARQLKLAVYEQTGLRCSIGLGPNRLIAKIASDLDKPDGLCVLPRERFLEVVGARPARIIPGVGPKTEERLNGAGIRTVSELAGAPEASLISVLGPSHGTSLRRRASGYGSATLAADRERKSESRERTFAVDETDEDLMRATIGQMARAVCADLGEQGISGRTVTLKIRLTPFRTFTRSRTLPEASADGDLAAQTALELFEAFDRDAAVRLLGVAISNLRRPGNDGAPEEPPDPVDEEDSGAPVQLLLG